MSPASVILIAAGVQAVALVLGILLTLWLVFLALPGFLKGPPYLGANRQLIQAALDLAKPQAGETVLDLGSGDGRLLLAVAGRGCRAVGYEINLFLVWWSRIKAIAGRFGAAGGSGSTGGTVQVHWRDFAKADLSQADLVLLYCTDQAMARLSERFQREMKPGARVVTLRYPIPGRPADTVGNRVFLYRF